MPIPVIFPLNATKMHIYLRSEPDNERRRNVFREFFKMWHNSKDKSTMLAADYVFVTFETVETISENNLNNDMVLIRSGKAAQTLPKLKCDDLLFAESVKYSASTGDKSASHVNLYAAATDIVNFDTVRNTIRQMPSNQQKESNIVCFGQISRDRRYSVPHCGNKVIIRSDHVANVWQPYTKLADKRANPAFNQSLLASGYITGLARINSGIRGIASNHQLEAIVTLPYELAEYQKFAPAFPSWAMDLIPTSEMRYHLPQLYTGQNARKWTIGFEHAPDCPTNRPILALIKTARGNFDNRELIRIHYKTDYRKVKTTPFPAVRFLLGRGSATEPAEVKEKIKKEIEQHDDIVIGAFEDIYDNLPLKTLAGYNYIDKKCGNSTKTNPTWVIFHDDDALIYSEKAIDFFNSDKVNRDNLRVL